jgi:BASS family bile acid:Na+ symporter
VDVPAAALQFCVVVFMVGSLGSAGLGVTPRAALAPMRHVRFVLLTLAGGWIVGPALAWLLLELIPLDRPYAIGLLLLSLAPCAPFAPAAVRAAGGDPAYAAASMILNAAGTAVLLPPAVPLLVPGVAADAWSISRPLLLLVLAPLALGMAIRGVHPRTADRLMPAAAALTRAATLGLVGLIVLVHGDGVVDAVGSHAILAQVIFVAATAIAGDLLGAPLPERQRSVLTLGLCTRNLGAALAPLPALASGPRAVVMIAIAVPITAAAAAIAARALARRAGGPLAGMA